MNLKKKLYPFFFTIDFEDFYFDTLLMLGKKNPESRELALRNSYKKIKEIKRKYLNDKPITFFVTGILAKKFPEIIREIHNDGNEIACHGNFHKNINKMDREYLENELDSAISNLKFATNEKPVGFRAPNFAIDEKNFFAYEELSKRFDYDSSFKTSKSKGYYAKSNISKLNEGKFKEYFIYCASKFFNFFKIKSGGTFLRLFPCKWSLECMRKSYELGHIPIVYLHPYELIQDSGFWIKWKDLKFLGFHKRLYWWLRQYQWSKLGHHTVDKKIRDICNNFEHIGSIKNFNLKNKF